MMDKLYDRAINIIAATPTCILSTTGPAGLQASPVSCVVHDKLERKVFLLVPTTSDHLFNLEQQAKVVLATERWQLHGLAKIIQPRLYHYMVKVTPVRMQIKADGNGRHRETIDF